METLNKVDQLISLCKGEIIITINPHTVSYESIEAYLAENINEIEKDIIDEIIKTGRLIEIQFYPHTPIGFYHYYHYDFTLAIDEALALVSKIESEKE
jgi:hypothetical protein